MKIKDYLTKDFMKVAKRATLIAMLTVGAVTPNVASHSQQLPVPETAMTLVAAAEAATENNAVQFERVSDYAQLAEKYPFLNGIEAQVKEYDEMQGGTNPTTVDVGTYKDQANNREMVFVHITSPVQCSYEGCPLSVYLKDSEGGFNLVHQINAIVPVQVKSEANSLSLHIPGAYGVGPGSEYTYNKTSHQFERQAAQGDKAPSPLDQIKPN